ncbi:MAG: class I SAM-dependent methyltransferase [Dehalococcoidia bacterium]|nr:class I SAM-dependent methyltransferase [Dehalococcoidia bacterium]
MARKYMHPAGIPREMGRRGHELDDRLAGVLHLMEHAPLDDVHTVLDVGFGEGQISKWLAQRGKVVTATGIEISSYDVDTAALKEQLGISIHECKAEKMPFADKSFDAAVMSHTLEHCPNVAMALGELWRVLREGGRLFVFVPPHDNYVCAGHVSMGWTVGQLMYVLLLAGFKVKDGMFFDGGGYNICGFVTKDSAQELPPLRGDRGDIRILNDAGLFPMHILSREAATNYEGPYLRSHDDFNDGFWGKIRSVNWPAHGFDDASSRKTILRRIAVLISRILPTPLRTRLATILTAAGNLFQES